MMSIPVKIEMKICGFTEKLDPKIVNNIIKNKIIIFLSNFRLNEL